MIRNILPENITCAYVRQREALGLGHVVLCAKSLVGEEPFAVILADDMIYTEGESCLNEMVKIAKEMHSSVVAVENVDPEDVSKYGVIDPEAISENVHRINAMVEKPSTNEAPSNLAAVGRYVLKPRIMSLLETTKNGSGGEIQLTDAVSFLLDEQRVLAYEFDGKRYDCGCKLGYVIATVEYALRHKELSNDFRDYLQKYQLHVIDQAGHPGISVNVVSTFN